MIEKQKNYIIRFMGHSFLSSQNLVSISLIYSKLLSIDALNFYLLSTGFSSNGMQIDSQELFSLLNINEIEFDKIRAELEKLNLIHTFSNKLVYLIKISEPLTLNEFLKHPILSRYYILNCQNNLDVSKYDSNYFDLTSFSDISAKLQSSDLNQYQVEDEERLSIQQNSAKNTFNFNWNLVSRTILPKHLMTLSLKNQIENVMVKYNLTNQEWISCIGDCVTFDRNNFDIKLFERKASELSYNKQVNNQNNENSYQFLLSKQNGIPLSSTDIKLIDRLKSQYKLHDEVINVILEYCLNKYDNKLANNIVEKIAASIIRSKSLTKELAINYLYKDKNNNSFSNIEKPVKKRIKKPEYKIENDKVDDSKIKEMYNKMQGW